MNKKTEKEKKSKINSEKNSTLILSKYHQGFSTKVTHNHNYHFCSTHTHHIKPITFEKISPTTTKIFPKDIVNSFSHILMVLKTRLSSIKNIHHHNSFTNLNNIRGYNIIYLPFICSTH